MLCRLARLLMVSSKISDAGVWSQVVNLDARKLDTQRVSVRDHERKLLYNGFLQYFSDRRDEEADLSLRNVEAFRYASDRAGKSATRLPGHKHAGTLSEEAITWQARQYGPEAKGRTEPRRGATMVVP